ncbi:hypothetical protein QYM36_001078 [Artemia franciscana]|uniref:RNA-directed DNA polymerase n=1 Tax=Artemia franciscana TaxID=6661 RepID=A0AA88IMF9_ARTSF|nr:hypothetical protein QYM36_001078 [Artemia franciscana]
MVWTKALARMRVWWQNIDDDIEKKVRSCSLCQLQQSSRAILNSPWPKATRVWKRVQVDFPCPFYGKIFMIVTFSKWIEVVLMNSMSSTTSIDAILVELVSANKTSFTSAEFIEFMRKNVIQLIHSPPYHQNSHGVPERAVRTCKEQIKKFSSSKEPFNVLHTHFLFYYRGNPHSVTGIHPARLFLRRELRNKLDLLKPTSVTEHKEKSKPTVGLRIYNIGDTVQVREYTSPDRPV